MSSSNKTDLKQPLLQTTQAAPQRPAAPPAPPQVPFLQMFRLASSTERFLLSTATIFAILTGAARPVISMILGNIIDAFNPANPKEKILEDVKRQSITSIILGLCFFISAYINFASWSYASGSQGLRLRREYFRALLKQDIAWFDAMNPNTLSTKINGECTAFQNSIGERVAIFLGAISSFLSGFLIGLYRGWHLTLALTASIPVLIWVMGWSMKGMQRYFIKSEEVYSKAGAVAEQAISSIKTVVSLAGEEKELSNFEKGLSICKQLARKENHLFAISSAVFLAIMFLDYAFGFYVASFLIEYKVSNPATGGYYTAGDVFTIFFAVMNGSMALSILGPSMRVFAMGKASAFKAFSVLDRVPPIQIDEKGKKKLSAQTFNGEIVFRNVSFAYPTKRNVQVLNRLDVVFEGGKKTALVGESGCGKTTVLQLIERFYDADSGVVGFDGVDTKELSVKSVRSLIGYVGQEPSLFACSIRDNLLMAKPDATEAQLIEALKAAQAWDFISSLPSRLDTFVGAGGAQLSGGQKQRIAIARAILRDPRILLLDEATSALDRANEAAIQKTLDEVSVGRTTIVIAHRLTSIKDADRIIVIEKGKVIESGTHDELLRLEGKYHSLWEVQRAVNEETDSKKASEQPTPSGNGVSTTTKSGNAILEISAAKQGAPAGSAAAAGVDGSSNNPGRLKSYKKRLWALGRPELFQTIIGTISAVISGCIMPVISIFMADILHTFQTQDTDFRKGANIAAILFLSTAVLQFISSYLQTFLFANIGDNLAHRLRLKILERILTMHIGFFDNPKNSAGALTNAISQDPNLVKKITGEVIGAQFQGAFCIICGLSIAFYSSWQIALVTLAMSPLMVVAGKMQAKNAVAFGKKQAEQMKLSSALLVESVTEVRTVAALGLQDHLLKLYDNALSPVVAENKKKGVLTGVFLAWPQFSLALLTGVVFYVGAIFVTEHGLTFTRLFQCVFGIVFAGMGYGQATMFIGDVGAAQSALERIFSLLDTPSQIDVRDKRPYSKPIRGEIEFKNVSFKYPFRDQQILKNLSLRITAGSNVALVGRSGCGKSTIVQLLMRFYDPDSGEILIDGVPLKDFDLKHLRNQIGAVFQEPTLFNETIEYNIKYTKDNASMDQIKDAALKAGALTFIETNNFETNGLNDDGSDESGFRKKVGPKGLQISGGQKQRIALARCVLREPSMFMFDEATSAMDNHTEKSVQETMKAVLTGKTVINVAHRITSIQNSDEIIVLRDGEIVERGPYSLLSSNPQGVFYRLERGINDDQ